MRSMTDAFTHVQPPVFASCSRALCEQRSPRSSIFQCVLKFAGHLRLLRHNTLYISADAQTLQHNNKVFNCRIEFPALPDTEDVVGSQDRLDQVADSLFVLHLQSFQSFGPTRTHHLEVNSVRHVYITLLLNFALPSRPFFWRPLWQTNGSIVAQMFQKRFAFTEAHPTVQIFHLLAACYVHLNHPVVRIYPELAANVVPEPVPNVVNTVCS